MARRRITIEQWIASACADQDKGQPLTAIALMYCKPSGGDEEIHTKPLVNANGMAIPQNPKQLAETFANKACGYSQDLPGIQTFKLLAFYGQTEPQATLPFTCLEGELTAGIDHGFSRHEPTSAGLQAQLMKHNEMYAGALLQIAQTLAVGAVQKDKAMAEERMEFTGILRDVFLGMKKEDQENAIARLKFQRETEERGMIGRLLPNLINAFADREIIPQAHADTELLDGIAGRLGPEQVELMVSTKVISEQEGILLLQRIKKVREAQAQRQKLLATAPPEHLNGANGEAPKEPPS